jgi:hypothetical protein
MREKRPQGRSLKAQSKAAVRASISFLPDLYETLEEIAKQEKASVPGSGVTRREGTLPTKRQRAGMGRHEHESPRKYPARCPYQKAIFNCPQGRRTGTGPLATLAGR